MKNNLRSKDLFALKFLIACAAALTTSSMCLADTAHEPFQWSFKAGENGMGGTEAMSLVPHAGKLFAGIGYWQDRDASFPGAQILVLDSPKAQWRVEHTFSASTLDKERLHRSVAALKEVTFHTNKNGKPLGTPVSLLLAANDDTNLPTGKVRIENLAIFSRDDSSGIWAKMTLPIKGQGIRSFGFHHDSVTNVDYVFAGTYRQGFVRGAYDETAPGKISWTPFSEPAQPAVSNRVMAFANYKNPLYAFSKPMVYEYIDGSSASGAEPNWREVAAVPDDYHPHTSGLRGATSLENGLFMGVLEGMQTDSSVWTFFPKFKELNICDFLKSKLGTDFLIPGIGGNTNVIGAYNEITKVTEATSGKVSWIFGLGLSPEHHCTIRGKENSSWFLARSSSGEWSVHEIPGLGFVDPNQAPPAVRAMSVSPFAEDQGQALYIAFYDTHGMLCHNTAHIFRVGLATALRPYSSQPCPGAQ